MTYFAQLNRSGYQPSFLPTQISSGWWSAGPQSASLWQSSHSFAWQLLSHSSHTWRSPQSTRLGKSHWTLSALYNKSSPSFESHIMWDPWPPEQCQYFLGKEDGSRKVTWVRFQNLVLEDFQVIRELDQHYLQLKSSAYHPSSLSVQSIKCPQSGVVVWPASQLLSHSSQTGLSPQSVKPWKLHPLKTRS